MDHVYEFIEPNSVVRKQVTRIQNTNGLCDMDFCSIRCVVAVGTGKLDRNNVSERKILELVLSLSSFPSKCVPLKEENPESRLTKRKKSLRIFFSNSVFFSSRLSLNIVYCTELIFRGESTFDSISMGIINGCKTERNTRCISVPSFYNSFFFVQK